VSIQQTLQEEIEESKRALNGPIDDTIYRRDHTKRIELINWVLENMKNPDIPIYEIIETRMNKIFLKIKETDSLSLVFQIYRRVSPCPSLYYHSIVL
jgi:uncharacterized protein YlaN (UPF0358 family)